MKRRQGWLFFIIFLLTLSIYLLINYPLQLGLDLQGGSQLTLQIIKEEGKQIIWQMIVLRMVIR